jgi:glycine/D-amino acid oxidase-like deaminating enzyme
MSQNLDLDPFWWEAAPRRELDERPLPTETDVAIVGSGFAGSSAGLVLARAGRKVTVLEKDRPGEGASSRNGGIASGNLRMTFGTMIKTYGIERAKAIYSEGFRAREDLKRFVEQENIDCDYGDVGRWTGANRPKHYESQAREADFINKHFDTGVYMVAKADQHSEIGSDLYFGGQIRPDIHGVHPGKLHHGILARAMEAGVDVQNRTEVISILQEGDRFEVQTSRGSLRARNVIVATNGYTGKATPWLQRRVIPIPSQIIATEQLPQDVMDRLMPKKRMLGETRNLYNYFRPSPDGTRIVFGGKAGTITNDAIEKSRHLKRVLVEIFPELESVALTHSWWGYTGFTFDFMPKLVVNGGVHYATGFCGSGVVWARWLGMKAAYSIVGNSEAETVFAADDFVTKPLYFGKPWFLPMAYFWYGLKDRMGL